MPRLGSTDSEVLIIPIEYSEVMVSAPSTAMMSWPRISPNRLRWVAFAISWARWCAWKPAGSWLKLCAAP